MRSDWKAERGAHDDALAPVDEGVTADAELASRLEGGLPAYQAVALENSPAVRAAFERWSASVHRIARARTLPEPTLSFGLFVQSVETRVGPQQARLGLQQALPWPTRLSAGSDAASDEARAARAAFDATALSIAREVAEAWWTLWEIRTTRQTHSEHLEVLDGLAATLRARMEVGQASLADLQQVDLNRARLADGIATMDEREGAAEARLRAVLGLRGGVSLPTSGALPETAVPAAETAALVDAALDHPLLAHLGARAEAADARARAASAGRLPSATVGADWILTGPAVETGMGPVEDSGKDAIAVGVGVKLPLWQGTYGHDIAAERASADAFRADQRASADRAAADVDRGLSEVRDSARRVRVTEGTLLPQAEAAYTSLLGSYAAGKGSVAQVLLAQQDLLALRVRLDTARADHARAWATLEERCGRELERTPFTLESE